jgi:integrase
MASIRQRAGRWQARVTRQGFAPETRTFNSKSDAARWARTLETELDQGIFASRTVAERTRFSDVIQRYAREVSMTKRGGKDEVIRLTAIARTRIAKLSMSALSAKAFAEYRDARLRLVAPATVIRDLAMLSSIINHCRREWGIAMLNPIALVRKPPATRGRNRVLEPDEEMRLLDALQPRGRRSPWMAPAVVLALETAMRRGELLSLRWANISLERRTAHLEMTKNGKSRTVPLSPRALATLEAMPRSPDGRVFPITYMGLHAAFRRSCARAGIAGLHFHDLRHAATTRLASRLPNVIELMAVTGHSDARSLARYYHAKPEDLALKLA